jgi:hypothetical protein
VTRLFWSKILIGHSGYVKSVSSGATSVIQYPRVTSNTYLATIRARCHELLPIMVVTLTCMPPSHTSPELGMVQYNEVIASLSLQISSRPSLAKPLSTRGLQPQTVRVDASYLYSSLGAALRLSSFLGYDVPLLQPQQRCPGQIQLSLLARSN